MYRYLGNKTCFYGLLLLILGAGLSSPLKVLADVGEPNCRVIPNHLEFEDAYCCFNRDDENIFRCETLNANIPCNLTNSGVRRIKIVHERRQGICIDQTCSGPNRVSDYYTYEYDLRVQTCTGFFWTTHCGYGYYDLVSCPVTGSRTCRSSVCSQTYELPIKELEKDYHSWTLPTPLYSNSCWPSGWDDTTQNRNSGKDLEVERSIKEGLDEDVSSYGLLHLLEEGVSESYRGPSCDKEVINFGDLPAAIR